MSENIQIAILAAGTSSRMLFPKQLLFYKGVTLIERIIRSAILIRSAKIKVVTGAFRYQVVSVISELAYQEVFNPDFEKGIGSSLKCLVNYLKVQGASKDPLLIVACDQLFVEVSVMEELIRKYMQKLQTGATRVAVVCDYDGVQGLPVILSPRLWEDLGFIDDREGAKRIWQCPTVDKETISCPQAQWDIDTLIDCKIHGIELSSLGCDRLTKMP